MSRDSFGAAANGTSSAQQHPKTSIGIIGGGMGGSFSVMAQINTIQRFLDTATAEEIRNAPSIDIHVFNVTGDPYDHDNYVFFLNQPASRMSVSPHQPNDFVDWTLAKRNNLGVLRKASADGLFGELLDKYSNEQIAFKFPSEFLAHILMNADGDTYMPRAAYGEYMGDRLKEACHKDRHLNAQFASFGSQARIHVHHHDEYVTSFEKNGNGGFMVSGHSPYDANHLMKPIYCDRMIVATGHVEGDLLKEFQGVHGYGDTPFTVAEIEEAVRNAEETGLPILLAGTGQASIDALGALQALDYKGKVIAVSGELIEPWPQDHKLARTEVNNFTYGQNLLDIIHQCAADKLSEDDTYAKFAAALQDAMHLEPVIAAGPAHLIAALTGEKDEIANACSCFGADFVDKLMALVASHDTNSTAPSKYEMYCGFKSREQLELKVGRVSGCKTQASETCNRFLVTITNPRTKESFEIEAGAILNAASMSRAALDRNGHAHHPAIQSLMEIGAVEPCPIVPGSVRPVDRTRILMVGVADGEGPFGVPYNRDEIWLENEQILEGILYRGYNQPNADASPDIAPIVS